MTKILLFILIGLVAVFLLFPTQSKSFLGNILPSSNQTNTTDDNTTIDDVNITEDEEDNTVIGTSTTTTTTMFYDITKAIGKPSNQFGLFNCERDSDCSLYMNCNTCICNPSDGMCYLI